MNIKALAVFLGSLLYLLPATSSAESGFYGGLTFRPTTVDASVSLIGVDSFASLKPRSEEPTQLTALYGGYRWRDALGIEAALSQTDKYALRPDWSSFGLRLGDTQTTWNLDVYTSLAVSPRFSLYGRLGVEQAEPNGGAAGVFTTDNLGRRLREGMNYGLGVRYDIGGSFGLRMEWARSARFGAESLLAPTDTDQLSFGLQYRF